MGIFALQGRQKPPRALVGSEMPPLIPATKAATSFPEAPGEKHLRPTPSTTMALTLILVSLNLTRVLRLIFPTFGAAERTPSTPVATAPRPEVSCPNPSRPRKGPASQQESSSNALWSFASFGAKARRHDGLIRSVQDDGAGYRKCCELLPSPCLGDWME